MIFKEKSIIDRYNDVLKKQQTLLNVMSNLGRKKDYEVQKIEKKYNEKIDSLVRKQQALAIVADSTQSYISKTRFSDAEIVTKKRD